MSASDALGRQYTHTVHRGVQVVIPTSVYEREVQPHLDRGDHAAAADAVMRHVTGYAESRPQENAVGRFGGVGVHWSRRRYSTGGPNEPTVTGASTFAAVSRGGRPTSVTRDEDSVSVPVLMRGVVHPADIDTAPPKHRAVFHDNIEAETHVRSGAAVSVRSAHVYLPPRLPETEDLGDGLRWAQAEARPIVRRKLGTHPA